MDLDGFQVVFGGRSGSSRRIRAILAKILLDFFFFF